MSYKAIPFSDMEVREEKPAFELCALGARHNDRQEVSWRDLTTSQVGDSWEVIAGGDRYTNGQSLQVVYKEDDLLVVLLEAWTRDEGQPPIVERKLFVLIPRQGD